MNEVYNIETEIPTSPALGAICINGICFRADLFNAEQWTTVNELMKASSDQMKHHYEKEIKLLRAKHRKAVKKLKDKLNKQNQPETIMN